MESSLKHYLVTAILFLSVSATAGASFDGRPIETIEWNGVEIECVQNEILLQLNSSNDKSDFYDVISEKSLVVRREADRTGFMILTASDNDGFLDLLSYLNALEGVEYAEPNEIHRLSVMPNDPDFDEQWSYHNVGQSPPGGTPGADIGCPGGWEFTVGDSSVIVAVLDTGIPIEDGNLSHPDLDDASKFIRGPNYISAGPPVDDNGHGTHVIGTIAAETDNDIGIAGVAYGCRVMAIKAFNAEGYGATSNFRDGVMYAVDYGCKIVNYSAGSSSGSSTYENAIEYALAHGVTICAAAGNNYHGNVIYPARYSTTYENVIAVSSTDHNDEFSGFSNAGDAITVAAPGGHGGVFDENDIYSTFPNYRCYLTLSLQLPQMYSYLAGTSMACPHASAIAALVYSAVPSASPLQVREYIVDGAEDLGPVGWDYEYGHGRIDVYNTLLQFGALNIGHTPFADTRDTLNPYQLSFDVFSQADLETDSILLHYTYSTGPDWYHVEMDPDRLIGIFNSSIPPVLPGVIVNYYATAKTSTDAYDTTTIFSFEVIDYLFAVNSPFEDSVALIGDTVLYGPISVTNTGNYADSYQLSLSEGEAYSSIWDQSMSQQITETPVLEADASTPVWISVKMPHLDVGIGATTILQLQSSGDGTTADSLVLTTESLGQVLTLPFSEKFLDGSLNNQYWVQNLGAEISQAAINEPSPPYSLNLDGYPASADTVLSQFIDISGAGPLNLLYSFQMGGGGEIPDEGDNLYIDVLKSNWEWQTIGYHPGGGEPMIEFELMSVPLPAGSYHRFFRIRIRNTSTYGERDDWFIDDVSLQTSPQVDLTTVGPLSFVFGPDETGLTSLIVSNVGGSELIWDLEINHDFSVEGAFLDLLGHGQVEPAVRKYGLEFYATDFVKGNSDRLSGYDVVFNAGGPDAFGYYWMDSDELTGPQFDWTDILATGTLVTGLIDDSFVGPIPIGFAFPFYGEIYSSIYISSNGLVGFGPPDYYGSSATRPIPDFDPPGNFIAFLWFDLNPLDAVNPGGTIHYQSMGDRLVIQLTDMPQYMAASGEVFTGQVILYQNGSIRFQYKEFGSGFRLDNCTIGIENQDGTDGLEIVCNAAYLKDNLAVLISSSHPEWIAASQSAGIVDPSESDTIDLTVSSFGMPYGSYGAELVLHNNDGWSLEDSALSVLVDLTVSRGALAGDATGDSQCDIEDVILVLAYIFSGGQSPNPLYTGDANCSGSIDVDDVVFMIEYIFGGGVAPCAY